MNSVLTKQSRRLGLLLVALMGALGCPGAEGVTWEVISLPQNPGQVDIPYGVAVDAAGNLYVADSGNSRVQQRDASGHWTVLATYGHDPGQVDIPYGVAVDAAGNLYVVEYHNDRIQQRDAGGHWTVLATQGADPGQVYEPYGVAVDAAGALYVAEGFQGNRRIQRARFNPVAPPHSGDGNGDGKVNVLDATLSLRIIVGLAPGAPDQLGALDVNADGTVSIPDVILILRIATGLPR